MRIYKTRAEFTRLQAAPSSNTFAGTVCTITDEAANPMYVYQNGMWNSLVTATTNLTGGIEIGEVGGAAVAVTASVMSLGDGHDEAAINAELLINKKVRLVRSSVISTPIILNSGNTLELADGVSVKFADSVTSGNIVVNRSAITVVRTIADGAITSGTNVFTSSSMSAADVGRSVIIIGAGKDASTLCATILTVGVGTSTLSTTAKTTVASATARFYDRDTNITLRGGLFDRSSAGNPLVSDGYGHYNKSHSLLFRRVDGLLIDGISCKSAAGKYAISCADVTKVMVANPTYDVYSDGFHLQGPATDVTVSGSRGTTGDDVIGVTGADYAAYCDTHGDIYNLRFHDTSMGSQEGSILLMSGPGDVIRGVQVTDLRGKAVQGVSMRAGRGDVNFVPTFDSDVGGVLIDGIDIDGPSGAYAVQVAGELIRDVTVKNLTANSLYNDNPYVYVSSVCDSLTLDGVIKPVTNTTTGQTLLTVSSTGGVKKLRVKNIDISQAAGAYLSYALVIGGQVNDMLIDGYTNKVATYTGAGNNLLNLAATGHIDNLLLNNISETKTKGLMYLSSGGSVGNVVLSNFMRVGCSRIADVQSGVALDITIGAGSNLTPLSEPFNISAGSITIRGGGCYFDSSVKDGAVRAGSEVIRVLNMDFPVDTAKVAVNAGDRHYNTNVASGALKVGPCIYSGSAWKSLLNIA